MPPELAKQILPALEIALAKIGLAADSYDEHCRQHGGDPASVFAWQKVFQYQRLELTQLVEIIEQRSRES